MSLISFHFLAGAKVASGDAPGPGLPFMSKGARIVHAFRADPG
jgi:hypothetical protein